jgi:hypothetical protein
VRECTSGDDDEDALVDILALVRVRFDALV